MSKRHRFNWRLVLLYPAVFLLVVCGGFIYGLTRLNVPSSAVPAEMWASAGPEPEADAAATTAPTVAEYRSEARRALEPFLAIVSENEGAAAVSADEQARQKVEGSIQAMLGLRVPAEERDFHLSTVLLMEQWKRALSGSSLDARRAVASAEDWLDDNSWLTP